MIESESGTASGESQSGTYLSRDINYLGNLRRTLQDLTGYDTLINELLQNADDAGAIRMRVDVRQDALVVFNSAEFTDCGHQQHPPESCLDIEEHGRKCDFHRFREVAGGDKRRSAEATGTFGIGFTAVYQVADTVELTSNKWRWEIDETRPAGQRIRSHRLDRTEGTTFVLAWARDPQSPMRQATGFPPVEPGTPQQLHDTLAEVVPTAVLFLRHLREVELQRDGQTTWVCRRSDDGAVREVTTGGTGHRWLVLHTDFRAEAAELRRQLPGILDERHTEVSLAIALDSEIKGRLFAYLPTEQSSGLPAHINADFCPESDRKHLLNNGVYGTWNRLAITAAARTASAILEEQV